MEDFSDFANMPTRGLDRASESGKFLKENKSMAPLLGITMLAVATSCFRNYNNFQRIHLFKITGAKTEVFCFF